MNLPSSAAAPAAPSFAPRRNWPRLLVNSAVTVVVLAVAGATFVLSYDGVHAIALQGGVSAQLARVYPGVFDALLVIACTAAVVLRDGPWWARCWAWLVVIVVLGAIGATDVLHAANYALRHRTTEGVVAAAPVVAVLLAFSLLLTMLRETRPQASDALPRPRGRAARRAATESTAPAVAAPIDATRVDLIPAVAAGAVSRPPAPPIALPPAPADEAAADEAAADEAAAEPAAIADPVADAPATVADTVEIPAYAGDAGEASAAGHDVPEPAAPTREEPALLAPEAVEPLDAPEEAPDAPTTADSAAPDAPTTADSAAADDLAAPGDLDPPAEPSEALPAPAPSADGGDDAAEPTAAPSPEPAEPPRPGPQAIRYASSAAAEDWESEVDPDLAGQVYPVLTSDPDIDTSGYPDEPQAADNDDAPPFATAPFASVPRLNRMRVTPIPPTDANADAED